MMEGNPCFSLRHSCMPFQPRWNMAATDDMMSITHLIQCMKMLQMSCDGGYLSIKRIDHRQVYIIFILDYPHCWILQHCRQFHLGYCIADVAWRITRSHQSYSYKIKEPRWQRLGSAGLVYSWFSGPSHPAIAYSWHWKFHGYCGLRFPWLFWKHIRHRWINWYNVQGLKKLWIAHSIVSKLAKQAACQGCGAIMLRALGKICILILCELLPRHCNSLKWYADF